MKEQYEIYDDPFKMLILLATLVAEQKGEELDYERVPSYENETFYCSMKNSFTKKDQVEITWYRFLGRDISCSKDLTRAEYNKMFVDCMASLYRLS